MRQSGVSGSIRYPGPLRQECRDGVTVLVYSHPAGNCLVREAVPAAVQGVGIFIPPLQEAPVVYAPRACRRRTACLRAQAQGVIVVGAG